MPNQNKSNEQSRAVRKTVAIILLCIAIILILFVHRLSMDRILSPKEMVANGAVIFSTPRELSEFSLLNQHNVSVNSEILKNKWSFVFFGFTYCPDICPATLSILSEFSKSLVKTNYFDDTNFIFVSLDPARDDPASMKSYVEYFNPNFTGLTGEFLDLHRFSKQLNVAFQKVVTNQESGSYTIDHSGHIALINPNGHFQGYYKPPFDLNRFLMTYKSLRASHK